jgi:hypothetical protein
MPHVRVLYGVLLAQDTDRVGCTDVSCMSWVVDTGHITALRTGHHGKGTSITDIYSKNSGL